LAQRASVIQNESGTHRLAQVVQQSAGMTALRRKPRGNAATIYAASEGEEAAPLFAVFVADEGKRKDKGFAQRLARADAANLRRSRTLSVEARQMLKAKHNFFEGAAKVAYAQGIRSALLKVTASERKDEIEMPGDDFSAESDAAVVKPPTIGLPSMDYTGPAACGGRPCFTDQEIYGSLEKSRLEDAQAEGQAIASRKNRAEDLIDLQADVEHTQRGTWAHRHAVERLETFLETGVNPQPYMNYEGVPGPENWVLGILGGAALGGAIAEGLALSEVATSLTYAAATASQTVASNPLAYAAAAIAYGVVMPPGSPDLPGPFDDVGKALRNLGVVAKDVEQFAQGGKVWGDIVRGEAKVLPYFKYTAGKLTAGILSAHWHDDKVGIVRAFFVFRQQSTVLAKALGAKVIRLEADVVMNTKELLPSLLKMGYKPIEDSPGSYFLEVLVP
jgi:hypothetical protein